ncbi:phosphoribosylformylglycinamidine synthase subunit PurS [candidate division FCPU426 bacterium]|nr:phosphoribosylformylglycinamidine synthase subunit PurS [candidate division FCPU426 bacterium]
MPLKNKGWIVEVFVTLKASVLDPQGTAVQRALHSMGYTSLTGARLGKYFRLHFIPGLHRTEVEKQARRMCEKLLVNPVIEQYHLKINREGKRSA